MKHLFPALCWAIVLAGVLMACAKHPKPSDPQPPPSITLCGKDLPMPDSNETILSLEPPTWTIFFDFNSSMLREAHKAAALAEYMRLNPAAIVFLAGHASQEGTEAYNLALGAKRAVAVRSYLEASGIPENRINWQSYGEEKPVTTDPAKYEMNRRVEITLEDSK